jgi:hypothetical protein
VGALGERAQAVVVPIQKYLTSHYQLAEPFRIQLAQAVRGVLP